MSLVFLICAVYIVSGVYNADPTMVTTQYGPIQGTIHGSVVAFQSIPYAKPPVGDLRWTMPQSPDSWTNVLPCNKDPPRCVQGGRDKMSEDCLLLEVFTPLSCINGTNKCAAMMWIHGGSYIEGYGGGEGFNGTYMAELANVIVVSINYRLG
eukprot:754373_1